MWLVWVMTGSPDPVQKGGEDLGVQPSPTVVKRLERLWAAFSPEAAADYGLLPTLPFDAVLARARGGEELLCVPRLCQLLVGHELSVVEARQVMELVASIHPLQTNHHVAVQNVLDAWWTQSLQRDGGEQVPGYPPAVVLGLVARWPGSMGRWLGPWLDLLDGPGSRHLVDTLAALELTPPDTAIDAAPSWAVTAPLAVEAWRDLDDRRGQFLGWARGETVVNGLVLIGATHLNSDHYPELLSDVLDLLLEG